MLDYIKRPKELPGDTIRMKCGCGNIYITLNQLDGHLVEIFLHLGKAGQCGSSQLEALGRVISTALRSGVDPMLFAKQLKGIRCPSTIWDDGNQVTSCADAIGKAIEKECERLATLKGNAHALELSEKLESSRRKAE